MRPVIDHAIVYIKGVVIIGEVGAIMDGIFRHLPFVAAARIVVEELLSMVGCHPWKLKKSGGF